VGGGSFGEHNRDSLFRFVERAAMRLFPDFTGIAWEYHRADKMALTAEHLHKLPLGLLG